jgi:hypothetical protein
LEAIALRSAVAEGDRVARRGRGTAALSVSCFFCVSFCRMLISEKPTNLVFLVALVAPRARADCNPTADPAGRWCQYRNSKQAFFIRISSHTLYPCCCCGGAPYGC